SLEPNIIRYRIRAVDVQKKRGRAQDAIQVAELAISLAKTPVEKSMAEGALVSAREFGRNPILASLVEDIRDKLHRDISKDKNATPALEQDISALSKLLDAGNLNVADDAAARYFRAEGRSRLNFFRKKTDYLWTQLQANNP